jgi:outer membrane protein assembly factor BamB
MMNRRTVLGTSITALLTGCLQFEETDPEGEEPQPGNETLNPESTPNQQDSTNQSSDSTEWVFESDSPLSGPATGSDRVYIGDFNQTLYAIDSDSGETELTVESNEFESTGYDFHTPVLLNNFVYARSNGEVLKINQNSGDVVKRFDSLFVSGDSEMVVIIGQGDGVAAYNPADGTRIWQSDIEPGYGHTYKPVLGEDVVVFGSVSDYVDDPDADRDKDTRVFALNRQTGDKVWDFTPSKFVGRSIGLAFATYAGIVAIADEDGAIFGVDATDGEVLWEQSIERRGSGTFAPQPTTFDDLFVFATGDIYGIKAENGAIQWTTSSDAAHVTSRLPLSDDKIWVPTGDFHEPSNLIDINVHGDVQNKYEFSTGYEKPPAIGNSSFYISHTNQKLRKYDI